jgi:hypothetical protein
MNAQVKALEDKFSDPWWRLTSGSLYKIMIKGDNGEDALSVPFIPNAAQLKLLKKMRKRNIILKARQLGFTTLVAIYFLDCALFRANIRAGIVAHNDDAAKTIFRDKVKHAYDNLPEELRKVMTLSRDSASELLFSHNNSSIRVGTSMRSGTLQYLHISEFGKICAKFPDRAKEVVTGSIPSVPTNGVIFIESTAEGQEGDFYRMSKRAQEITNPTPKDYAFHFFPWWGEERYRLSEPVTISEKEHAYFDKVEAEAGTALDIQQRAWWVATRDADYSGSDESMWQEYPSTPKEAFQQSTEGCYYTVQLAKARKDGRVTNLPYRPGHPVNTFWDIGSGDGCAIWFHQRIGQYDNFIKFIEAWAEPYSYFVTEMQKTGWVWGSHYLPHDGNHIRQGQNNNLNPKNMLENLGLKNIEIVKVVEDVNIGIQATRNAFATCWFDEDGCKEGLNHLANYKKAWSATNERFTDHPKHDIHSEAADSFRQFGQSYDKMTESKSGLFIEFD